MNARSLYARKALASATLVGCGLVAGGTVAALGTANAADSTPSPSSTGSSAAAKPAETALTGDTLSRVKAAVLAKYPGATFTRVETDSDGTYEAHIVTAAGENVTAEVDKAFTVTGTEAARGGGGRGHGGGKGGGAGETPLTGDTLAKVKAAVLAKYAGATFDRVETDSDGVYEAHITTAAGDRVTVELDKAYAITGTE
ncbi:MAG: hypothetical protein QOE05_775 [Actinomycetota bacterium]|jgi:uncharacterized membrane protein YkoI|nr:hypothetical protein [Actinomycetota bacterium]